MESEELDSFLRAVCFVDSHLRSATWASANNHFVFSILINITHGHRSARRNIAKRIPLANNSFGIVITVNFYPGLPALRLTKDATLAALPRRLVFRGNNVVIHPTATVEASVLGDGVSVGAYSYVRNSVVGDGCVIEQRAHVNGCALGPRTFVSLNSSLSACVTYGDTDACTNGMQACVIGPRCALTSFARPLDLSPGGPVKVDMHGEAPDATDGAFTSYWEEREQTNARGSFTAPFAGTHGWYWRNKGDTPVTVTVKTTGFYKDMFQPAGG